MWLPKLIKFVVVLTLGIVLGVVFGINWTPSTSA